MMKKLVRFLSLCLCAILLCPFAACVSCSDDIVDVDETKSTLYVSTRDAGIGTEWFEALAKGFEEKYADTAFEDGKVGVQVITEANRNNTGTGMLGTIKSSLYSVMMLEQVQYTDYMGGDLLYDISDLVKTELSDGSGTIESKLDKYQKDYLTGYNGNYYALPWLSGFTGITYNADLFELYDEETNPDGNGLYFADVNGYKPKDNSSYTGSTYTGRGFITADNSKKSPGPDGKYNTFDDGLPSSYEEFFYLCDYMAVKGVIPFIYYGGGAYYVQYALNALTLAWSGAEEMSYNFSFDSGDKTAKIITGFSGETPIIEDKKITPETGYLMSQQEAPYYAAKFLKHLYSDESKYFAEECFDSSKTNLDAQELFIDSVLNAESKPIAMLIEGNYWYGESSTALKSSVEYYGEDAAGNRNFRWMSMPGKETGTVNEGEGRTTAVADGLFCYFVVNNNIKGNAVKTELATKFIQYCYEDASLQKFTSISGMPAGVDYELTTEQYDSLEIYKQSCWDIYKAAVNAGEYLSPVAGNKTYMSGFTRFGFSIQTEFWSSKIGDTTYNVPRKIFKNYSAKEYFNGRILTADDWKNFYIAD